jgi:hypothetical protein
MQVTFNLCSPLFAAGWLIRQAMACLRAGGHQSTVKFTFVNIEPHTGHNC